MKENLLNSTYIDRYFAQNLSNSLKKQKFLKAMVSYLKSDDITVILEGFEEKEDYLTGKELGIHLGQGYYLGRPTRNF